MISEVTPRGREFLFFSLFSIIGKTSSFIGPLVSSSIIDDSAGIIVHRFTFDGVECGRLFDADFGVDLEGSRREQEASLVEEEKVRRSRGPSSRELRRWMLMRI
jgi:hypothetical protein